MCYLLPSFLLLRAAEQPLTQTSTTRWREHHALRRRAEWHFTDSRTVHVGFSGNVRVRHCPHLASHLQRWTCTVKGLMGFLDAAVSSCRLGARFARIAQWRPWPSMHMLKDDLSSCRGEAAVRWRNRRHGIYHHSTAHEGAVRHDRLTLDVHLSTCHNTQSYLGQISRCIAWSTQGIVQGIKVNLLHSVNT